MSYILYINNYNYLNRFDIFLGLLKVDPSLVYEPILDLVHGNLSFLADELKFFRLWEGVLI